MRPLHQGFQLFHPAGRVVRQIGIDIVVICDGIGRAGISLDHFFPAGATGMPDESGVPYSIDTKPLQIGKGPGVDR